MDSGHDSSNGETSSMVRDLAEEERQLRARLHELQQIRAASENFLTHEPAIDTMIPAKEGKCDYCTHPGGDQSAKKARRSRRPHTQILYLLRHKQTAECEVQSQTDALRMAALAITSSNLAGPAVSSLQHHYRRQTMAELYQLKQELARVLDGVEVQTAEDAAGENWFWIPAALLEDLPEDLGDSKTSRGSLVQRLLAAQSPNADAPRVIESALCRLGPKAKQTRGYFLRASWWEDGDADVQEEEVNSNSSDSIGDEQDPYVRAAAPAVREWADAVLRQNPLMAAAVAEGVFGSQVESEADDDTEENDEEMESDGEYREMDE
ncbi:hypothetical protein BDZ88DRAFT_442898 [Geranomyces variabilis]|nr:hypothetical protein BDZ88DRAFT_442898 [Geranomyces variabilis]